MDTKLLGGILLVVGTAIGGGMLALPIATSQAGFANSLFLMFGSWLVMTVGALLVLEVCLWMPPQSNIISMAKATLGVSGELVAWITYLLLFYSVITAYIAGGSDFLNSLLASTGISLPHWIATLIFTLIFGSVVYCGIRSVDYVNRGLMFSKFATYVLLVLFIMPFVSVDKLLDGNFKYVTAGVTVMITSFTFANIIPSLRTYFKGDIFKLRKAVLIGSFIPLICYIIWDMVIMGVIPLSGDHGLISMLTGGHSTSEFVSQLSNLLHNKMITLLARIFTSICLATSFLASALGLSDFLADGLKVNKKGKGNLIVYSTTFLPPVIMVLFYPNLFITALSYAGIYCAVLMLLLPALMAWSGRYRKNLASGYRVKGGKPVLVILILVAVVVIAQGLIHDIHL